MLTNQTGHKFLSTDSICSSFSQTFHFCLNFIKMEAVILPLRSACHKGFSACPTVACSISTIFSAVKTSLTEGTDRGLYISSICSAFCSITKLESGTASLRPSYNFARHSFVLVTTLFSAGSKNERLLSTVGLIDSKIRNYKKTLLINFESVLRQILLYYQCKCQEFRLFYIKGKTVDS